MHSTLFSSHSLPLLFLSSIVSISPRKIFVSFSGTLKYMRLRYFCALRSFSFFSIILARPPLWQMRGILSWLLVKSLVLCTSLNTTLFRMLSRWSERLCGPDVMKAERIVHGEESLLLLRRPAIPINQPHAADQPRSLSVIFLSENALLLTYSDQCLIELL